MRRSGGGQRGKPGADDVQFVRCKVKALPDEIDVPAPEAPEGLRLLRVSRPAGGRACVFVEGESCAEKAAALLKLCPEVRA